MVQCETNKESVLSQSVDNNSKLTGIIRYLV